MVQNLPVPFDRRVWLEATTLVRAGHAVSVICPKMKGFNKSLEELEGVAIHRYPLPVFGASKLGFVAEFLWCFLAASLLSLRVAWGRGFDVLHVCNPPETYWPLAMFWQLFGKRFIFDHHDLSPEMYAVKFGKERGLVARALRWLEKMTFRAADLVITTNESHKEIAVRRGAKHPDDVYVVRSGPSLDRFKIYPPDPAWRNGAKFLLVYLGEICAQDGVDHMVRAVKHLTGALGFSDVHAVFVGGGPHQPAIKQYAAEIGVANYCNFTGRVSDEELCRILSSADIAIDPDPKNDWSNQSTMNKIIEYMYFGLPIVCYDLKEARVSADAAALYVEPNDDSALARGVLRLIGDPKRRQQMRGFGMDRVRAKLAWEFSVPPLLAAYDRAFGLGVGSKQLETLSVVPAKAGTQGQGTSLALDSSFRGNDGEVERGGSHIVPSPVVE
ncbi:MAG TPA: glycosyltransferase family 4 protein [Stellaceae bacterium]|nr:glycosyltransferase family 4 protein [Stellaceae bacterium]